MLRKVVLALTVAATFAGAGLAMTAPAQADWRGHHWRPHPRYYHGPVYGLSDGYFNPPLYGNCRWVRKVWWSHHEMHRRVVRVCY